MIRSSSSSSPTTLRVRAVSFLNGRPLVHSLIDPDKAPRHEDGTPMFELGEALPAECARALAAGECELALVPVASYIEHPEWEVVPGIGIGCRGPVETVVVCAERPLEAVELIYLDGASRSSALLLRLLLHELDLHPQLERVAHGLGEQLVRESGGRAAALIIGDAAFGLHERFDHCWDLGAKWFEATGLPMVFAFWAARPGVLDGAHVEALQWARDRSLGKYAEAIAKQYRDELIATPARERGGQPVLSETRYADYLRKTIRYGLETQQREGLVEYLSRCREAGLIEIPGLHAEDQIHVKFVGASAPERLVAARRRRSEALDLDAILARAAAGTAWSPTSSTATSTTPTSASPAASSATSTSRPRTRPGAPTS